MRPVWQHVLNFAEYRTHISLYTAYATHSEIQAASDIYSYHLVVIVKYNPRPDRTRSHACRPARVSTCVHTTLVSTAIDLVIAPDRKEIHSVYLELDVWKITPTC
ncbi:hypothetical protein J6590_010179 [Homalodisca vitripennis]|nr:hypothetical protein J6590_010179 [Homalodisca vitripennis]